MSTFGGKLVEQKLGFIRIDQFEHHNHDGEAFFLSHFHTDHYKGLFDTLFTQLINGKKRTKLYCSPITKALIMNVPRCKFLPTKIFELKPNETYLLEHGNEDVTVTALPAGHCPGSVMFLFVQPDHTRVLYTGDIRIDANDLRNFNALHDSSGALLKISSLYLDTTFCNAGWPEFPSREQSVEEFMKIAFRWLLIHPKNEIGIWYNSYYGLEYLLVEIARQLRSKVWAMDYCSYFNYSIIPELHDSLSSEKGYSRIHLCMVAAGKNCPECAKNKSKTLCIKPSAYYFSGEPKLHDTCTIGDKKVTRLVYSNHCSLNELTDVVKYLSPEKIYPCVVKEDTTSLQILECLNASVEKAKEKERIAITIDDMMKPLRIYIPKGVSQAEMRSDERGGASTSGCEGLDSPPL